MDLADNPFILVVSDEIEVSSHHASRRDLEHHCSKIITIREIILPGSHIYLKRDCLSWYIEKAPTPRGNVKVINISTSNSCCFIKSISPHPWPSKACPTFTSIWPRTSWRRRRGITDSRKNRITVPV